jgi:hypothetical protein
MRRGKEEAAWWREEFLVLDVQEVFGVQHSLMGDMMAHAMQQTLPLPQLQ